MAGGEPLTTTLREEVTTLKLTTAVGFSRIEEQVVTMQKDLKQFLGTATALGIALVFVGLMAFAALMMSLDNRYRLEQQRIYGPPAASGVPNGQ